jgi:hypothetical protein
METVAIRMSRVENFVPCAVSVKRMGIKLCAGWNYALAFVQNQQRNAAQYRARGQQHSER